MPLDRLVERILSDAGKEAERIAEGGCEEKKKILDEAYRMAEEKYGAGVREIAAIVERDRERALKASSLEARKEMLAEKRALMKGVFDRAIQIMLDQPREQYLDMLTDMAADAFRSLGAEEALVVMNDEDMKEIGDGFVKGANVRIGMGAGTGPMLLSEETRPMSGGFVLKAGRIEIDNSLEAIIESRREELEDMVAGILFKNVKL